VRKLTPPDSHHVTAAEGWLELGNPAESKGELARVSPKKAGHPEVLETWFALHAHAKDWPAALAVAEQLVATAPKRVSGWLHRAYALRRTPGGSVATAYQALRPALNDFPKEPTIPYNLACYACVMGRVDEAWDWLGVAMQTRCAGGTDHLVSMALADEDLAALHKRIDEKYNDVPF